ncbi:class A beta-lactamase [Uniformispora flossi]|uniref:class A beta-lactamase n=1 Tax=Uniformispora flossi TaxID=3390723 RepID=UPI003C2EB9F3
MERNPSRRGLLVGLTAAGAALVYPSGARAFARETAPAGVTAQMRALEQAHGARLGVFAHDPHTGRGVAYRADERFPMCSTFKTLAVGAVLRDLDRDGEFLATRLHYTEQDTTAAGYAPITGQADNLAHGMTVAGLCAAAIAYSDNAAANLLLRRLGGPAAVTRFCRSLGDPVTRLDRWEPALNSAEPDRITDTSTPRALAATYARLTLGRALDPRHRELLTGWLLANTTGAHRIRAGLPRDWTVADKTGTGGYGTANDVALAWPPSRGPLVLAVLTTKPDAAAAADEPLLAAAASVVAAHT